jgi:hypothetical protein
MIWRSRRLRWDGCNDKDETERGERREERGERRELGSDQISDAGSRNRVGTWSRQILVFMG